jgi:hypothetical protein
MVRDELPMSELFHPDQPNIRLITDAHSDARA